MNLSIGSPTQITPFPGNINNDSFDSTFTFDFEILSVLNAIYDVLSHVIIKISDPAYPASPGFLMKFPHPSHGTPARNTTGVKNSPVVAEAREDSKFKNDIIYLVSLLCIVCTCGLCHRSMLRN